MAKKDQPPGSSKPKERGAPKPDPAAEQEAQREKEKRGLIETLAGYGMPLDELGLLLVPALSGAEVETRYGLLIEQGKAKAKGKLVQLIWQSAEKNPTIQIYLSKVMLGWNEKTGLSEPKVPEDANHTPPAGMPTEAELEAALASGKVRRLKE